MEYYCNICSKTIKCKSKKKHINSKNHIFLSEHITTRYEIINQQYYEIEDILEKYIKEHTKRFLLNWVICKYKTVSKTFTLPKLVTIEINKKHIRNYLMKIRHNHEEILEMDILFISFFDTMTYKHYLQQPKPMLEWTLLKKVANNPEFENYSNLLKFINSFGDIQEAFPSSNN